MLNARQIRFAWGVAEGKTATEAYVDAGYSEQGAAQSASQLLTNPKITACVTDRIAQLAAAAGLDASWVLKQWKEIAEADPNELCQIQLGCCRHCWGIAHEYQWTGREYRQALDVALNSDKPRPIPEMLGGFGFDFTKAPNEDCPECRGEGIERRYMADTRRLKGSARRLYAGVKMTAQGPEIKMRDQDGAVKSIASYLGMVVTKGELSGPGGGPIPIANFKAEDLTDDQLAALVITKGTAKLEE